MDISARKQKCIESAGKENAMPLQPAEFQCFVPWLDQRPLINATGSNENECHVNLTMLDLSDEELQRVIIRSATLSFNSQK